MSAGAIHCISNDSIVDFFQFALSLHRWGLLQVTAIGDLQAVGAKLAKSRGEEVVSAKEREVEGTLLSALAST